MVLKPETMIGLKPRTIGLEPRTIGLKTRKSLKLKSMYDREVEGLGLRVGVLGLGAFSEKYRTDKHLSSSHHRISEPFEAQKCRRIFQSVGRLQDLHVTQSEHKRSKPKLSYHPSNLQGLEQPEYAIGAVLEIKIVR